MYILYIRIYIHKQTQTSSEDSKQNCSFHTLPPASRSFHPIWTASKWKKPGAISQIRLLGPSHCSLPSSVSGHAPSHGSAGAAWDSRRRINITSSVITSNACAVGLAYLIQQTHMISSVHPISSLFDLIWVLYHIFGPEFGHQAVIHHVGHR